MSDIHDPSGPGPSRSSATSSPSAARYRFELERRDFIRVVGGGLVVVSAIPSLFAQESGRGRAQGRGETAELAAWLHIDEQGHVTGYTGKTEIGQNIRTSLAQAIADELRVGLEAVTLVMADTDLVPYDAGTFGSQSTPRMGRQLSRAAATAREMLIDQAAARWQVDRATLAARGRPRGRAGRPLVVVRRADERAEADRICGRLNRRSHRPDAWTVRGHAAKKVDGRAFVTGRHEYSPDVTRPGLLHGRIIRPDSYDATLASVNDAARAGDDGRDGRPRRRLPGRGRADRARRRAARRTPSTRSGPRRQGQPSSDTIYEHLKEGTSGGRTPSPFTVGQCGRRDGRRGRSRRATGSRTSRTCRSSRARPWRSGAAAG